MKTQAEVNQLLDQLTNHYNGSKPDYWGYPGECLSYVKRWYDTLRNGVVAGAMTAPVSTNGYGSGWFVTPPAGVLELFDKQGYNPSAQYPRGSLFTFSGSGHIGILLDNQPSSATALVSECNADPDGSPVHSAQRSKARIDGVLVLRVAPPPPSAPLWTVTPIPDKLVKVHQGHRKWNLGNATFAEVASNPITVSGDSEVFTARGILHHREIPQYNYYVEDVNTPHGWNVLDCMDYYVPPPPPAAPGIAARRTAGTADPGPSSLLD